ncbi:MAG: aminotransferase class I/II-fold pyridoxal phosphate-dependent enzyme [Acidobacteria bacterium]|nr:aminotransferase class I/II-fold pyridoxal phosphate-dependent enzyme [Acidobacteriota bacterium]
MRIETFEMERWQSKWEHRVSYNLSESGVHPLSFEELVPREELERLLKLRLGYIQTNGTKELKQRIMRYYPGAGEGNILVTTGSCEANFLLIFSLIEQGDEAVFMLPNFMQIYGLLRAFGAEVKTFTLREELRWMPDLSELKRAITKRTKLICITNPNNPTGARLNDEVRGAVIDLAKWAGAWLIVDEVYQGAELDGRITPTFFGSYEKCIVVSGLSKAYGLPGLRVGWIVGPEKVIDKLWSYKDYTTITISGPSDRLARLVLEPEMRERILERTRRIIRGNLDILEGWIKENGLFHLVPPSAGAIAFARYDLDINATELAHRVRERKGVLLQPGDQLGMDGYIRFGLGEESDRFREALSLVGEELKELRAG